MPTFERWTLPDGTPLTLRPVQAGDAPALAALVEALPTQQRRWRFHGAVAALAGVRLERMTHPDPRHELALVVARPGPGGEELLADARCVVDATGRNAEFALMVAAPWQRRGIGARALAALQQAAARRGLHWLYGSVLADNAPMLSLVRQCGFRATPHRGGQPLVVVESHLARLVARPPSPVAAAPARQLAHCA